MMSSTRSSRAKLIGAGILLAVLVLLTWRIRIAKPGDDARGVVVWIEIAWLLLVYLFVLFAGLGLGRIVIRYLNIESFTRLELVILEFLIGLALLSFGVMVL